MRVHLPADVAAKIDPKPSTYADAILHGLAKKNGYTEPQARLDVPIPVGRAARRAGLKERGRLDGPNSDRTRRSPRASRPVPSSARGKRISNVWLRELRATYAEGLRR